VNASAPSPRTRFSTRTSRRAGPGPRRSRRRSARAVRGSGTARFSGSSTAAEWGSVYLARQRSLERLVVVEVIRPELRASDTARARFRRDAEAAPRLHHPHLVQVLDVGEDGDVAYLVLKYVPGRSLGDLLKERDPPDRRTCVRWILQLARALDYAHGEGVVHSDVKPGNILVDRGGARRSWSTSASRAPRARRAPSSPRRSRARRTTRRPNSSPARPSTGEPTSTASARRLAPARQSGP